MKYGSLILAFCGLVLSPLTVSGQLLTGDFFGMGPGLAAKGIVAEAVLTTDFLWNVDGGLDSNETVLGNVDITCEIDSEKVGWWRNGTLFLYGLGNFNSNGPLTEIVGDTQGTSNIEAIDAVRLYEAWYEHQLSDNLGLLVGLHDYNGEFYALEYAALFTNSSFGISPDISQVGPSIFPVTALGIRFKVTPTEASYLQAVVYDGIAGDPESPRRTAIRFDSGDGVFAGLEVGMTQGEPDSSGYYKLAGGAWLHTAEVETFDGTVNDDNGGVYLIAEKMLFSEAESRRGLGAFVQAGFADRERNPIASYLGFGLHYSGILPARNHDTLGLAVAIARNGNPFMQYVRQNGGEVDRIETAIELTYRAQVAPWLVLQPDCQYVINPGMDPAVDNALLVGFRMELIF